ncbi:hypothetical protein BC940DRAFT_120997 [Gongronella butleri]|nr:hypothetical protein BC940DRAFT_120997 [Gongronella butleri]
MDAGGTKGPSRQQQKHASRARRVSHGTTHRGNPHSLHLCCWRFGPFVPPASIGEVEIRTSAISEQSLSYCQERWQWLVSAGRYCHQRQGRLDESALASLAARCATRSGRAMIWMARFSPVLVVSGALFSDDRIGTLCTLASRSPLLFIYFVCALPPYFYLFFSPLFFFFYFSFIVSLRLTTAW